MDRKETLELHLKIDVPDSDLSDRKEFNKVGDLEAYLYIIG